MRRKGKAAALSATSLAGPARLPSVVLKLQMETKGFFQTLTGFKNASETHIFPLHKYSRTESHRLETKGKPNSSAPCKVILREQASSPHGDERTYPSWEKSTA